MNSRILFVFLGALALFGCSGNKSNIDTMGQADPFQKTITPPNGTGVLTQKVQALLVNDNWRFQDLNGKPLAQPRYTIKLTYDEKDKCLPKLEPKYEYSVSIIDNRTGGPTFVMHGTDCEHTILDHLDAFLLGKKQ